MTIKELYEYAKIKGFENLPLRYGYIDYDGICRLQDFYLPDFAHDAKEVTVWFSEGSLKRLADKMSEEATMNYAGPGNEPARGVFRCSHCGFAVLGFSCDFCPSCGRKIKEWK